MRASRTLQARAGQAGAHFSLIEENVAIGPTPAAIHDGWMHSPGHRANLLNPDVDRVGVAVVAGRGVLYAVADYERAVPVLTQARSRLRWPTLIRASGVAVLRDPTLARAACAADEGMPAQLPARNPRFVMRWQDADLTRLPQALVDRLASGEYRQAAVGSCPPQGQEGLSRLTEWRCCFTDSRSAQVLSQLALEPSQRPSPPRLPPRMPRSVSSKTRQSAGATPSRSAASRNASGAGLPFL